VVWSSEGARVINKRFLGFTRSCDTNSTTGKFINTHYLPTSTCKTRKKVPNNGVLEGLTFNNNYSTLFTNVEEPLYEDSPMPQPKAE
jgi:hypothetical protein